MKRILKILLLLATTLGPILLLCACSGFNLTEGLSLIESLSKSEGIFGFKSNKVKISEIEFIAAADANNESVTSVDLVIVYENGPISQSLQTSANDYFAHKDDFIRQNAGLVKIQAFELVPGYNVKQKLNFTKKKVIAAFLFIHYWDSDDINHFRIGESGKYIIKLHRAQPEIIDTTSR